MEEYKDIKSILSNLSRIVPASDKMELDVHFMYILFHREGSISNLETQSSLVQFHFYTFRAASFVESTESNRQSSP